MRKSTTILKELEENKELLKAKGLLEDEKEFILDEIKDLEAELKKALEAEKTTKKTAAPKKRATVKKKTATRKKATTPKAPAKPKEKKFVMVDDKKVFEDDPKFCEIIIDQWKARKEAIKKAAGKRKTKSVIQRAAADVADAVSKGIRNIKVEDIKKDPKSAIKKMERLEKAGREFLSSYKDILGEKITQKEIEEEFGGLEKAIKQIEAKYLNPKTKMAEGGEVDSILTLEEIKDNIKKLSFKPKNFLVRVAEDAYENTNDPYNLDTYSFDNIKDAYEKYKEEVANIKTMNAQEVPDYKQIELQAWDEDDYEMEILDEVSYNVSYEDDYGKLVIQYQHVGKGMNYAHKFIGLFFLDKYTEKDISNNPDKRFSTWTNVLDITQDDLNGLTYDEAVEKIKDEANLKLENNITLDDIERDINLYELPTVYDDQFISNQEELDDIIEQGYEMLISLGGDTRGEYLAAMKDDYKEVYKSATGKDFLAEDDTAFPISETLGKDKLFDK